MNNNRPTDFSVSWMFGNGNQPSSITLTLYRNDWTYSRSKMANYVVAIDNTNFPQGSFIFTLPNSMTASTHYQLQVTYGSQVITSAEFTFDSNQPVTLGQPYWNGNDVLVEIFTNLDIGTTLYIYVYPNHPSIGAISRLTMTVQSSHFTAQISMAESSIFELYVYVQYDCSTLSDWCDNVQSSYFVASQPSSWSYNYNSQTGNALAPIPLFYVDCTNYINACQNTANSFCQTCSSNYQALLNVTCSNCWFQSSVLVDDLSLSYSGSLSSPVQVSFEFILTEKAFLELDFILQGTSIFFDEIKN